MLFFFFKQKTAYEMRISDWSSDVCSSDLPANRCSSGSPAVDDRTRVEAQLRCQGRLSARLCASPGRGPALDRRPAGPRRCSARGYPRPARPRSEEHTSELQSLMRISYAVFCLKKKTCYAKTAGPDRKTPRTNHSA